MTSSSDNRFQDFFEDEQYVALKNYLYNYLLRKRAVEKVMKNEKKDVVLEVGSGISPVLTSWDQVVYSDLSFSALRTLMRLQGKGHYVVADGMNLPFKANTFSHTISSEVLEHMEDDRKALPHAKVSVNSSTPEGSRLRFAIKGAHPGLAAHLCSLAGLDVVAMRRTRLARIVLSDLPPGQWRYGCCSC